MLLRYSIRTALTGLATHKSRSALTILGIVIGIAAIIIVVSLGEGAQNLILNQVQSIGSKVIAIIPGREPKGPTDFLSTFTDSLKDKDIESLLQKNNVPHAAHVMPIVFGSQTAAYENETYRPTILGVTDFFADIYNIYPEEGRVFTEDETKSFADVAVIGSRVKNELFGADDALEKKIKIKGKNFRVIGILPKKGQISFLNFDEVAFIPYTTARQYIFGIKYFNRIVVEADAEDAVAETVDDIKTTLRNNHGITDSAKDDFFVQTQAQALETVSSITNVLKLFLAAIAAISLVVGGIGIMNIMLVSVTERTKEIGLRKALGATEQDLLIQFLLEATILTVLGGIVGITLGTGFSFAISLVLTNILGLAWLFSFPLQAVFLGVGVAAVVGFVFGIYPAWRAAKLNPVDALRYE
jgi:putative ABC transport system permease protein